MSKRKSISITRGKVTKRGSKTIAANAKKKQTTNVLRGVFIGLLATVVTFASVAVLSRNVFAEVGVDGRMMPANVGVEAQLRSDEPEIIDMISVEGDDTVLSMLGIYYLDGRRASVDINFPIWMNNGTTLKFLSEDIQLVTTDLYTEKTFAGLYISEGTTYTEDLIQADWEEFIFILLPNGLYMNVQNMDVVTPLGTVTVPANSILMMTQDYFRYYIMDNSCMAPKSIDMSNEMTIVFGENQYEYFSLLKKLGLFHEETDPGKDESQYSGEISNNSGKEGDVTSGSVNESEKESESIPGKYESGESKNESNAGESRTGEDSKQNSKQDSQNESGASSGDSEESSEPESESSKPQHESESKTESGESHQGSEGESEQSSQGSESESRDKQTESGEHEGESGEDSGTSGYNSESEVESEEASEGESEQSESQEIGSESESEASGSETSDESESAGEEGESESGEHESEGSMNDDWDDDDEDEDQESHTRTESEESGSSGSGGRSLPYRVPTVSVSNFDPWCYAINLNLKIKDRSKAILGGVKITVWSRLENGSYSGITTEDGYRVFTAKAGKNAVFRRTFNGSSDVTLSIVPPNTTLYIQYSYRYYLETKTLGEEGEEITTKERLTYTSDFYEITTQPATSENFYDINMGMNVLFATSESSFILNNFSLTNTSDYDATITDSYENFKKDSLPYINRIELKLTKVKDKGVSVSSGATISVKISASTLNNAKLGTTIYKATAGILEPDCVYSFKVTATDKYNNRVPLLVNTVDSVDYRGTIYTSKDDPEAKISVDENITDKITLRIKISDAYGALLPDADDPTKNQDIYLVAEEIGNATQIVVMSGEWKAGMTGKVTCDAEGHVVLKNPQHGKEYVLMIDSLAFAQAYHFYVYAGYNLQPSAEATESLKIVSKEVIGDLKAYTASLSSGLISLRVDFEHLTDTSVDVLFKMLNKTTTEILPIVDEFRFTITNPATKQVAFSYTFSLEEFGDKEKSYDYLEYDEEEHGLILQKGDANTPGILLLGEPEEFEGVTPWDAFLITKSYDEVTKEDVYSGSSYIKVIMPSTLTTSTQYSVSVESVVIKGGREYTIPTTLSNTGFMTRKIAPKINYDTFFIAGNVAEFINYQIYDPDGTILNDGLVYAYLYYGDTLLTYNKVYASTSIDSGIENLRFENLIIGGTYTIKLVAQGYNDAEGWTEYQPNYTSETDPKWVTTFKGGSNLYADATLAEFEYASRYDNICATIRITGEEVAKRFKETEESTRTGNERWYTDKNYCNTEYFEIPEGTTFFELVDYEPETLVYSAVCINYYNASGNYIGYYYSSLYVTGGFNNPVFPVMSGAKYFMMRFGGPRSHLEQDGFYLRCYSTPQLDIMHDESTKSYVNNGKSIDSNGNLVSGGANYRCLYKYPVNPGDVYAVGQDTSTIYYYSADGTKIMSLSSPYYRKSFVIPEDVAYMSLVFYHYNSDYALYRIAEADHSRGYTVTFDIDAYDKIGYLSETGAKLTVEIYRALTEQFPDFPESFAEKESESEVESSELESEDSEESTSTTELDINDYLEGECCYRTTIQLTFDGTKWVYLDNGKTLTFTNLAPNNSYMFVLSCEYLGSKVVLDTETLRTDGRYVIVDSQFDLFLIQRANFDNYYVVKDFTINQSVSLSLYGLVEFNGHTITLTKKTYSNGMINYNYGTIRNLVVTYEETRDAEDNVTTSPIPLGYVNYGVVENVIIKTPGDIYVSSRSADPLLYYQNGVGGLIRNVEIELNGDAYVNGDVSLCVSYNSGIIDSIYLYATEDYGIILDGDYATVLIYYNYYTQCALKHCYTNVNLWLLNSNTGNTNYEGMIYSNYIACNIDGWYHLGDFYNWTGKRVKLSPSARQHLVYDMTVQADVKNTYLISHYSYSNLHAVVKTRDYSALYDPDFQRSVLGDAFDVDECVLMHFFPRLKFPSSMQMNQAYVSLPSLSLNDVTIASDGWASGTYENIQNESGNIVLTLHNPSNTTVSEVEIEGLKVTQFVKQGPRNDGSDLYDVIMTVTVDAAKPSYASTYAVKKLVVTNGAYTKTFDTTYNTTGFSFWKPIATAEDWMEINSKMSWNYRLTENINFEASNLTQAAIMINGSKVKVESTTTFSGQLDGAGHTISGIKFLNNRYPYVFYYVNGSNAKISNLYIEGLQLTASNISGQYCGFIRNIYQGMLENVHCSNCSIEGTGFLGTLCAYMTYGSVHECSVVNSTVKDNRGNYTVYAGGLMGYNLRGDMLRCFARNITVNISYSKSSNGVGGLCGYMEINTCTDCYAQGKVTTCCDYTGGLVGWGDSFPMLRCFADVDVISTGSYVGGVVGKGSTSNFIQGVLTCGDVVADGAYVNRVLGSKTNVSLWYFAYDKQSVTGLTSIQTGDCGNFLSKDELKSINTWKDWMLFGDSWNYDSLDRGVYPKLISKNGGLVPHQEDIVMPGQGGEPVLTYSTSVYNANLDQYAVSFVLEHPSKTHQEISQLIASGDISFDVEGLDFSEAAILQGISNITFGFGVDDYSTQILLEVFDPELGFLMRKDSYKIKVTAKLNSQTYQLQAAFSFPNVLYWEISDLTEWNNMMGLHGQNTENFKITGVIDFNDSDPIYKNLSIGRLEGDGNAGFTNMHFVSDKSGTPWIENVFRDVKNLTFSDFTVDFGPTTETRGLTGLIMLVPGLNNCTFTDLDITMSSTTTQRVGFFSQVRGVIESVTLTDSSLKVKNNATRIFTYGGILAGYCMDGVLNSTFTDLSIEGGYEQAGCAVGSVYDSAKYTSSGNTFTRCTCNSYYNSGACFGRVYKMADTVITDCSTVCAYYAGHITGWCRTASNVDIYNCAVESKAGANGYNICVSLFCNNSHSPTYTDIVMINCKVVGKNCNAGLIAGYTYSGSGTFKDCVAVGCEVTTTSGTYADATNAGGFVGNARISNTYTSCVIRDTKINGKNHAGGFVGYSLTNTRMTFTKCEIAEDTVITATNGTAGGLVGQSYLFTVQECAVGGTIKTSSNYGAGGFVGNYIPMEDTTNIVVKDSIFAGNLMAPDYASAVIGRFESATMQLTADMIHNVIVMGSISTSNIKATPWGTAPTESGACGDMGVLVYEGTMINGQTVKGIWDSYQAVAIETAIMPTSGVFITASDLANKTTMIGYGLTETNWSYDHYGDDNTFLPYPRATVNTTLIAPYADTKIIFADNETGVLGREYYPDTAVTAKAGILLPSAAAQEKTLLVYPSAIDSLNIEYLPNAEVNVNGTNVTLNELGVLTIAYNYTAPITINNVVYQVSDFARTVMTSDTYWYYIADDGIHYGNNYDTGAVVQPKEGSHFADGAYPVHMWGGYVLFSDATIFHLIGGSAVFDSVILGTSRTTHALYSYTTSIGNDPNAQVNVYARFTMFADTMVEKQSFLLIEYNSDNDPVNRYYSPEGDNVPDGIYLIRYRGADRDHRYLVILNQDGTLHSYLDTGVLGSLEITNISHISNSFYSGERVLLARYNDGNVIGIDILTGTTYIDTRTATDSVGGAIRNAWNAIFGNPGPNFVYTVDQLPDAERDDVKEIISIMEQESAESATESSSEGGHGGSEGTESGSHGGQGSEHEDPEEKPEEENIYYSESKGIYTDNKVLYTPEQVTKQGNDILVNGKVVYTAQNPTGSSDSTDGKAEEGQTESGSGSSMAEGSGQGQGQSSDKDEPEVIAVREVHTYTMEEIYGESVMMLNEDTNKFEEVDVKDLNEKGSRKADRASDEKKDEKQKAKKTLSEVVEEIRISWNTMSTPQRTGYIFIVLVSVAVVAVLIVATSHFVKKKKVNK